MRDFSFLSISFMIATLVFTKLIFAQRNCPDGSVRYESSGTIAVSGNEVYTPYTYIFCTWIISVNSSKVMNITFKKFFLPNNCNCTRYLDVYDKGRSIYGSMNGTDLPKGFRTKTRKIRIVYTRFWNSELNRINRNDEGYFELTWQETEPENSRSFRITKFNCGQSLSNWNGVIQSPSYPNLYSNNLDCQWNISAKPDQYVVISFNSFHVESSAYCNWDYLVISSRQESSKICSFSKDIALQGPVTIHFHSDGSVARKGFSLKYILTDRDSAACSSSGTRIAVPSGSLMSSEISFESNMSCTWIFTAEAGKTLQMTFHQLNDSCQTGSISLEEKLQIRGWRNKSLCGILFPKTFQSTTNTLRVTYNSQTFYALPLHFGVSWSSANATKETAARDTCTSKVKLSKGFVLSANFPLSNTNYLDICWTIENPNNHNVLLEAIMMDIEYSAGCQYDYLILHYYSTTTLRKQCEIPVSLNTNSSQVSLIYHSDDSIAGDGYIVAYAMKDRNTGAIVDASCGRTNLGVRGFFFDYDGFISSPGFPFYDNSNLSCVWTITADSNELINIMFLSVNFSKSLNCSKTDTHLEFLDGSYSYPVAYPVVQTSKRICYKYEQTSWSSSRKLQVTYHVNRLSSFVGRFALFYRRMARRIKRVPCGGNLNTNSTFNSLNYPKTYPTSLYCYWYLHVPENQIATIHIDSMNVESSENCSADVLEIFENPVSRPLSLCGNTIPRPISFSGTHVVIRFISDFAITGTGFHGFITTREKDSLTTTDASTRPLLESSTTFGSLVTTTAEILPSFTTATGNSNTTTTELTIKTATASNSSATRTTQLSMETTTTTSASTELPNEASVPTIITLNTTVRPMIESATTTAAFTTSTFDEVSSTAPRTTSAVKGLHLDCVNVLVLYVVTLLIQLM